MCTFLHRKREKKEDTRTWHLIRFLDNTRARVCIEVTRERRNFILNTLVSVEEKKMETRDNNARLIFGFCELL